jgi:hypothetical protein
MAFAGDTSAIIFDAILNRNPIPPARLNPIVLSKLEDIINKLLEKDRKLRYQSASDLEADLRRVRRDSDVSRSAVDISPAEVPTKRLRLKVWVPVVAVVGAAIVVAIFLRAPRASALTERDVVVLSDFVNTTGDTAFDGTLKQALAVKLQESPFLNIFPEDRVRETLRYMSRSPEERLTNSVAREICQREGLKAVLADPLRRSVVTMLWLWMRRTAQRGSSSHENSEKPIRRNAY